MIEDALVEYVANALAAWVGDRVYYLAASAGCPTPYVTIRKISCLPTESQEGENGWEDARFELRLYSTGPREALQMRKALRDSLAKHRGLMRDHKVAAVSCEGEFDDADGGDGSADSFVCSTVDYRLIYRR